MSQRLQVLLDKAEFAEIRRVARRHRMTVAEWVRQALRQAREAEPSGSARRKLAVVREVARASYPTADLPEMLDEIERGKLVPLGEGPVARRVREPRVAPDFRPGLDRAARLRRLLEQEVWPDLPADQARRALSRTEEDAILGYGPAGA